MSRARRRSGGSDDDAAGADELNARRPRLALGLLATVPLLLIYEASLAATGGERRNTAEVLVSLPLEPLGSSAAVVRVGVLLALLGALVWRARSEHAHLGQALLRVLFEGFLAALCLGPALLVAHGGFAHGMPPVDVPAGPSGRAPGLAEAGLLAGAGGWEELVFRLLAYSLVYLLARHVASFFGVPLAGARIAGDVAGVLGSAALFAAFHLASFTAWLGPGGEPFDAPLFAWRFLGGLLLGLLFRWRGLGVAAWAHAVFNVALALGAGPGVFLGRGVDGGA